MPSFWVRLAVLLAFLAISAAWDRRRFGAQAQRPGEYAFLLLCGLLGALLGASLDQISVRVSPEFFEFGKGLRGGPGLSLRASILGGQAGFVAGLVAGGVLLLVNQGKPERPALTARACLATALPWIVGLALTAEAVGYAWLWRLDPANLRPELAELHFPGDRIDGFVRVQAMHLGLYSGAVLGLVIGAARVWARRGRQLLVAPSWSAEPKVAGLCETEEGP